ncbi:MAG: tyrosine-type recombinase/integrase [Brevefilum sp.]|nr:tyrosine-type recombinase/integrase [Brevefilum sp.]MDW7753739.1 tyrosine-type recombinase/integrase [Brevefilum sp.]
MSLEIISPEDRKKQNQLQTQVQRSHNKNPVVSYLASLGSKDSRRVQKTALDQIANALSNGAITDCLVFPWEKLDYGTVNAIKAWLDAKYAPSTVNRYLCAVRRVIKEAWRHQLISAEEYQRATDVQSVSAQRLPTGRELENNEIRRLIDASLSDEDNPTLGLRDAAIISLMYSSGLRRAEVVTLDLEDIDLKKGELRVIGKRNKERKAFLANGAVRAIEKWLEARGIEPGPLFYSVNKGGNIIRHRKKRLSKEENKQGIPPKKIVARLSDQTVYHLINKRAKQAGLIKKTTPHDMRRTFVSDLLEVGVDLATVSKMAGHEDTNTTKRYDRRSSKVMQEAVEKLDVPYPED